MRFTVIAVSALAALAFATPSISQNKDAASGAGGHGSHGSMGSGSMKMESSPGAPKAPFDLQFIDTMVMHHQSAIEMADLVESRSAHDELKKMAKKMSADQQGEIQRLQEWKQQWYAGKGDAVNMNMQGMMESMKDMPMDKLKAAKGDEFDALFIDMMTRHHSGAIKMAQDAQSKAQHSEIKKLAQEVIREQKKEIAQMAIWKKEWKLSKK